MTVALSSWMSTLPAALTAADIREQTWPGSHDSGAYQIDTAHPTQGGWFFEHVLNPLANLPGVHSLCCQVSQAQAKTIAQQLETGIRFLDFRIARAVSGIFYLAHTFTCTSLNTALADIHAFLHTHPSEVVQIAVQNQYPTGIVGQEAELYRTFEIGLPNLVFKANTAHCPISIDSMRLQGRVAIFFHDPSLFDPHSHEPRDDLPRYMLVTRSNSFWQRDTSTVPALFQKALLSRIENEIAHPHPARFNFIAYALTPTTLASLKSYAAELNPTLADFVQANQKAIKGIHARAITVDFADEKFVRLILSAFFQGAVNIHET